jgi:mannitol/fructose-specific phosphotransferase system IIA component (Ntr-type)
VEEAVWQREATYSTGFGRGFAIPHCKSNAVRANSLVLLKPRAPIPWNSLDGQPVRVVILLAIREPHAATRHMQVLAKLARLMIDREFCGRLEQESSPRSICAFLQKTLEI